MFAILTTAYETVEPRSFDSSNLKGKRIPGSTEYTASIPGSSIWLQQLSTKSYSLHYCQLALGPGITLRLSVDNDLFRAAVLLKGRVQQNGGKGKLRLREGQFSLSPCYQKNEEWLFAEGKFHEVFTVGFSRDMVDPLVPYFPKLALELNRDGDSMMRWTPSTRYMPAQVGEIIRNILNCSYEPALREFYFEDQVRDLLLYLLIETTHEPPQVKHLTQGNIEKIHQARSIILSDLTRHFSIGELARKVGLNEFKIKVGFRQLYNMPPFTMLKEARMKLAHDQLLHTDKALKEIAALAGYSTVGAFVSAFQKQYGYTTSQLRGKGKEGE